MHLNCRNSYEGRTIEHDLIIQKNWNNTVTNGDFVYILGDIGRLGSNADNEYICSIISTLKGKKVLVLGNHDKINDIRVKQLFYDICDYKDIKFYLNIQKLKFILTLIILLMLENIL